MFEEAGPDALISCKSQTQQYIPTTQQSHCLTVPKNIPEGALGYTFTASCNWTPFRRVLVCEEARKELGKCPIWDAIAYQSVRSTPGVIYVKEDKGFTTPNFYTTKDMEPFGQQGVGRCLDTTMNTCRTDAPPPRGDAALPIEPGESWCDTLADFGGRVIQSIDGLNCPFLPNGDMYGGCDVIKEKGWGVCSEKPKLPSRGFDYDADYLTQVRAKPIPQLFAESPECGNMPLRVRSNRAGRYGGGMFQQVSSKY